MSGQSILYVCASGDCSFWPHWLLLCRLAALWRGAKPISLNSWRATQRDTEVLQSNFTVISPHHCERPEGSGRWQPEGEEMGSDSGCIPSHPILSSLFSPFSSPHNQASSGFLWLADRHTQRHTFFRTGNTHWEVYLHSCNRKYSHQHVLLLPLSFSRPHKHI